MVRPRKVRYSVVYFTVIISSTFGAELPNEPLRAMCLVKVFNESLKRIAVSAFWIGR